MITITKKFNFCYSHILPEHKGRCKNLHGHNSEVEVEVGPMPGIVGYKGMIVDFGDVKKIAGSIIDDLDHKYLNEHPAFCNFCEGVAVDPNNPVKMMLRVIPTAELICQYLVYHIQKELPGLNRLRVSETPDSWAEWRA